MLIRRFLAVFLIVVFCESANAGAILDQENWGAGHATGGLSNGSTFGRSQTFTVGLEGTLDSIVSAAWGGAFTSAHILATAGGAPIGGSGGSTVLAMTSSVSNVGNVFTFDFSAANLAVSVGDILAIEIFGSPNARWAGGPRGYAGGSDYYFNTNFGRTRWTRNHTKWQFRSYVDVPEPASVTLFGLGLACLGWARGKRA